MFPKCMTNNPSPAAQVCVGLSPRERQYNPLSLGERAGERVAATAKQLYIQFENPNTTTPFQMRWMTPKVSNPILQLYLTQGQ